MPLSVPALVLCALASQAPGPGFGFDRVDVLSEDPGSFLNFQGPMLTSELSVSLVRLLEQVKPVWTTPVRGLYVGTSISSQSVVYEHPLLPASGLFVTGGIQTRLLLPRGAMLGLAWRWRRLRVGLSLSALSQASWARPNWQQWSVLPTLGIGIGRSYSPPAPP